MHTKLRRKIFIYVLLSLLLLSSLFHWALASWIWQQNKFRTEEHLKTALGLGLQIAARDSGQNWQQLAEQISRDSNYRVSFISSQGQILADSALQDGNLSRLEDHGKRPEVQQARDTGFGFSQRHSSSLEEGLLYMAQPVPQKQVLLRLAAPLKSIEMTSLPWSQLVLAAALGLVIIFFMAHWLARAYNRPLEEIRQSLPALALGQNNFAWRGANYDPVFKELGHGLEQLAARIKSKTSELEHNARRMHDLLQAMAQPVLLLSHEISLANPAAEKLFGPSLCGRHPAEVIRSANLLEAIEQTAKQQQVINLEARLPGGQVWEAICSPLPGPEQRAEVMVILHDITQARKLEQIRKDFVANLSHEIRTPLAVIQSAQETLSQMPGLSADQTRFLQSIERQVKRMSGLMKDLLQLAHLESAQWQQARPQKIALPRLVSQAALAMREKAAALAVEVKIEQPVPEAVINGQYNTLEQALTNLLDNAIKYSNGQVGLRGYVQGNYVYIEVEDNGPGIAPEHLERIFERFYRVEASRPAGGGTGLGLSIVRHGVMLHGGRVKVQSQLNQGSRFTISLPLANEENDNEQHIGG